MQCIAFETLVVFFRFLVLDSGKTHARQQSKKCFVTSYINIPVLLHMEI